MVCSEGLCLNLCVSIIYRSFAEEIKLVREIKRDGLLGLRVLKPGRQGHDLARMSCASEFRKIRVICKVGEKLRRHCRASFSGCGKAANRPRFGDPAAGGMQRVIGFSGSRESLASEPE
jgi:hypothetical protein